MLKKQQRLTVRFTAGEQQQVELAAYAMGVTPSEFIRTLSTVAAKKVVEELKEQRRQEEATVLGEFVEEAPAVRHPDLPNVPMADQFTKAENAMNTRFKSRSVTRG